MEHFPLISAEAHFAYINFFATLVITGLVLECRNFLQTQYIYQTVLTQTFIFPIYLIIKEISSLK